MTELAERPAHLETVNIDATLLQQHKAVRREETVVQLQNGCVGASLACFPSWYLTRPFTQSCICCTLRGDLLEEVAAIAEAGGVDYLLIESCASPSLPLFLRIASATLSDSPLPSRSRHQRAAAGRGDVCARV